MGGTPYDIKGVEFGHVGDRCSFDAIVRVYDIHDAALDHLADDRARRRHVAARSHAAVRGPAGDLLWAVGQLSPTTTRCSKHGMIIYDALYTWCRLQARKT